MIFLFRISEYGYVYAPTKPGLGYDIDWDVVEKSIVRLI
jgi:L-alanine-DL-glutamate epimerase-like enolase superfamily enzyme